MKLEDAEKVAMKVIEDTGEHRPQVIFNMPDGSQEIALMYMNNDAQKDLTLMFVRAKVQKERVKSYLVIMEAWVGKDPKVMPRNSPDKEEALVISEYTRELKNRIMMHRFTRDGDKIIWGKRDMIDETYEHASPWNVYVEDVTEEKMKAMMKNARD